MFYVYIYREKPSGCEKVKGMLKYGPFKTKPIAKAALRRRGWKEEGGSGMWFSASSSEDGSFALIRVARSSVGLMSWRKWKRK